MHPMLRGCKVEAKGLVQPTLLVLGLLCFQCHWTTQQMWVSPALQVATGLAAAGHADAPFWAAMEAASERRLLSFSGHHLAQLMVALGGFVLCGVALATSGHVPSLNWLQRTEIQASKHWRAMSPGALAGTVWAWGRLNYTPSRGDSPLHAYLDYSNKAECRQCKTGLACGRSCKATDRAEDSMCCRKTKAHVVHQSWQAEKKRRTKLAEETHPISIKEKETQWLKSFDRQQRNPCRAFTESFSGTAF
eukprot:1149413-Pelagomonas_calceolata.AAC.15